MIKIAFQILRVSRARGAQKYLRTRARAARAENCCASRARATYFLRASPLWNILQVIEISTCPNFFLGMTNVLIILT